MAAQSTRHDAVLWYDVGDWKPYNLAVPNWGDDQSTQNTSVLRLTNDIGRHLCATMWHKDARLRKPPTINTIRRIARLCERGRSILAGRSVPWNIPNMEAAHAVPAPEAFHVYPCPFFDVANPWMKEWAHLVLYGLTEAFQHTSNADQFEVNPDFASRVGQYIQRVYLLMASELLLITDPQRLSDPQFTITEEEFGSYDPSRVVTSTEMIDVVPDLTDWPTEDMLRPLTDGIPVTEVPLLPKWPGPIGATSSSGQPAVAAGASFPPPPRP